MSLIQLLILSLLITYANCYSGFIKSRITGNFLTCNSENCEFSQSATQIYKEEGGNDGQSRFTYGTQCLDRESCHSSTSDARLSDCNHCGTYHWKYDQASGKLGEDKMSNCIQYNGKMAHCSTTWEPVDFYNQSNCEDIKNVKGYWINPPKLGCPNGPIDITYDWGTKRSYSVTNSEKWGESVTTSVESGFEFEGVGSAKVQVSGSVSHETAKDMTSAFETTESESCSVKFDKGGCVWQFVFETTDSCGTSYTYGCGLILTPDKVEAPCCLPGYNADPTYQTCLDEQYNVCQQGKGPLLPNYFATVRDEQTC